MPLRSELQRLDSGLLMISFHAGAEHILEAGDEEAAAMDHILERDYLVIGQLVSAAGQFISAEGGSEEQARAVRVGATLVINALKEYGERELFSGL